MTINILHVTKQYEENIYGGVESYIHSLCSNLNKKKFVSDVYTVRKKRIKKVNNYNIYSHKETISFLSTPFSLNSIFNFRKVKRNYDLINFHFPWPFMDLLSFFVEKKKIIVTYHSDITQRNILYYLYLPLMLLFLYRANKIIVTSRKYFNSSKILKYFKKKIIIIPIGINKKYKVKLTNEFYKKKLKKKYFIFVGRLRNYKGIEYLIEAFKHINSNLVIVGSGKKDQFFLKKIRKTKNIFYLSDINETYKIFLISNSQCLILPSIDRREAFGMVLLEAFSHKKPVITTEINSGNTFVNLHLKTGLNIKPKNITSLIKACNFMLEKSKLRKRMGVNAYKRFKKYFHLKVMLQKYENLILSIFNNINVSKF